MDVERCEICHHVKKVGEACRAPGFHVKSKVVKKPKEKRKNPQHPLGHRHCEHCGKYAYGSLLCVRCKRNRLVYVNGVVMSSSEYILGVSSGETGNTSLKDMEDALATDFW